MSDTFTASSGRQIECDTAIGETRVVENGQNMLENFDFLNARDMNALREFFQHERDKELGRWRWPEDPNYTVRPSARFAGRTAWPTSVDVEHEPTGLVDYVTFGSLKAKEYEYKAIRAAKAYYEAHPEPKPEWHDAKAGQAWVIEGPTFDEAACTVVAKNEELYFEDPVEDTFISITGEITNARRIWPEVPSE